MKNPFQPRYFLASIALLLVIVVLYAASAIRRTQHELTRQLEEKGIALAEAFETSSQNAIRGNALMEEMIAQRLFDNARLIDQLLFSRPFEPAMLKRISAMNRLRRVDLLDREGRPYTPSSPSRGMMGPGMMEMMKQGPRSEELREAHRRMMMYMWGRQWGLPSEETTPTPPAVKDRKFWEGSLFGVAIEAQSFPESLPCTPMPTTSSTLGKRLGLSSRSRSWDDSPASRRLPSWDLASLCWPILIPDASANEMLMISSDRPWTSRGR